MSSPDQDMQDLTKHSAATQGIENLVLSFLQQLVHSTDPTNMDEKVLAHERRARCKIRLQLANRTTGCAKTLVYPKKNLSGSARPLAQLFRVMDLAHEAIVEGIPMTKRDIFYNDVQLFKSQRTVDTLVDDLAATLDLDRSSFNIRASSKGLICGSGLTIYLTSGEVVRPTDTEATLIPAGEDISSFGLSEDVRWVLIIEKEAVFQTLCHLEITDNDNMPGRGLLITGKGYPDIATRHLVKTLADCLPPRIPIMALVDGDPYGLDILSVYNYGSRALKHENERLAAGGRVIWIGIWASEFSRLGIDKDKLLPISKGDEKKAFAMLNRSKELLPSRWKKELMHMLFTRRKAEIEILSSIDHNHSCQSTTFDIAISSQGEFQEQRTQAGGKTMETSINIDDQMEGSADAADTSNIKAVVDDRKTITMCGSPSGMPMIFHTPVSSLHRNFLIVGELGNQVPSPQLCQSISEGLGNAMNRGARNGLFLYVREKVGRLVNVYETREG